MAGKKKRRTQKTDDELIVQIHRQAGRAKLPPNKVFRDKSRYSRKTKHRKSGYQDGYDGHSFFIASAFLSLCLPLFCF